MVEPGKNRELRTPLRVLLLEDSEDDALLLVCELERGGYEPKYRRVETPVAMREALAGSEWDLVISAHRMARFGSSEALAIFRESDLEAPFIVVGGMVGEEKAVEAIKAGAYDYVMKDNLSARLCASVARGLKETEERRRVKEKLERGEKRHGAVVEQIAEGLFILDAETRTIVEANPAFQRLLGYSAEELEGMSIYDLVENDPESVNRDIRLALERGHVLVGDGRYLRKDGSAVEVDVSVSVISCEGKIIAAIARDVTGRKKREEALRESEELFRNAFENAPIGMAMARPDGRWLRVNRPLCDMLGYTETELLGTTFQEVTHPDDIDISLENMRRLSTGELRSYQLEKRYIRKDGRVVWALLNVSPVRDAGGEPLYGIAQIQDITERKRAEEALRESEERFRSAFESAPIGMALVRLEDGRWLEVNEPLCEITGYPERELLELTWLEVTHPDDLNADLRQVERMLRGEIRAFQMEKRYIHKDGHVVWVLLSSSLVRDVGGKPLYGIAQVEDITARKQAEWALKQSEELYRTVIEQATENIFLVDVETRRIVESNPAFREALGYYEEELERMTLYDVVAADRESVDLNVQRTLQMRRSFVGQRRYRRKDGTFLDVEASASVILRDARETFCVVAHDVTERVRAQKLLEERLTALSRLGARLTLDLPVQDTLDAMAKSVVRASTADTCSVALIDEGTGTLRMAGSYGLPEGFNTGMETVWQEAGMQREAERLSPTIEAVRTRRPVFARNSKQQILDDPLHVPVHDFVREPSWWDTVFVVPLVSRGRALGTITFGYPPGQEPGENERIFLGAIADQAAIAVENARLFAQARDKAALEERQRLARELHDSVSQALYGISLGAETAREVLEEDPEEAAEPLDYVLALSEAGIAEMRALIFELRPESLEEEGLCVALEKQAEAVRSRHKLRTKVTLCDEPDAALEVKEALYRISQEALNNTVKHAHASEVRVGMECESGEIALEVSDDGIGFDPEGDFRGHLGLRSMRERASKLGGSLEVNSAPGKGTRIRARILL